MNKKPPKFPKTLEKGRETSTSGTHTNCTNILYYYSSKKKTRGKKYGKKSKHAKNMFPYFFKNILYYNCSKKKTRETKKRAETTPSQLPVAHARTRGNPLRVTLFPVKTPEKRPGNPNFRLRMSTPEGTRSGHYG